MMTVGDRVICTRVKCNVPGSSLVRESEYVLMTRAGVEIGVASTKAFTAQLTAFLMLVMLFSTHKKMNMIRPNLLPAGIQ